MSPVWSFVGVRPRRAVASVCTGVLLTGCAPIETGARGRTERAVTVTAAEPEVAISGEARLVFEAAAVALSGRLDLLLLPQEGSTGAVVFNFRGIRDRITGNFFGESTNPFRIEAFDGCVDQCAENFTIVFTRTDELARERLQLHLRPQWLRHAVNPYNWHH
jgi:hypothetical protein